MKIGKVLIILLCLLSCRQAPQIVDSRLTLLDSMDLPFGAGEMLTTNILKSSEGKDSLLLLHRHSGNMLFLCDLNKKRIVDSLNLNQYTQDSPEDIYSALDAKGNLYILECGNLLMKIINRKSGESCELRFAGADSSIGLIIPLLMPLIIFEDSSFYAMQYDLEPLRTQEQRRRFYCRNPIAKFHLTKSSMESISSLGGFPEKFKNGLYYHFSVPMAAINRDSLLYCFNDLNCFIHSTINQQATRVPLEYESASMPEISSDSMGSISYSKALTLRTPTIARIHYKSTSDRLLIFYKPPAERLSAEGELNTYIDCDNYILSVPLRKKRRFCAI